jgi:molybdate transport system permease protein
MDWTPLILTFKLALITTVILVVIAVPLAYKLAHTKSKLKPFIEALVSMPLVLPPTVLGFYLLLAFSPSNGFGYWLNEVLGLKLIFSFPGLVFASIIYSLPFMVHPIQSGFKQVPTSIVEAAYVLGKGKWETLIHVILPNMKSSIITGMVLSFAHTIGEFGVVLMIGGNIPGETKVASIAIYDEVETLNYGAANTYSMILFGISFSILLFVYLFNGKRFMQLWR